MVTSFSVSLLSSVYAVTFRVVQADEERRSYNIFLSLLKAIPSVLKFLLSPLLRLLMILKWFHSIRKKYGNFEYECRFDHRYLRFICVNLVHTSPSHFQKRSNHRDLFCADDRIQNSSSDERLCPNSVRAAVAISFRFKRVLLCRL